MVQNECRRGGGIRKFEEMKEWFKSECRVWNTVKNVGASERNVELNRMPERRCVTECDGAMTERHGAMSECDGTMTDVASTYVLCPRFEEPGVR